jgi:alcohol dehydrogenase, propanol-preferring
MKAMVMLKPGQALRLEERALPQPSAGEILVRVCACAVCRTDLHVVDGELPARRSPIVPGHEIVGRVEGCGIGTARFAIGDRVGIPWLGGVCAVCEFCLSGRENLCDKPTFTGYTRDGGFAAHVIANADFAFHIPDNLSDVEAAPLLCAGLIGWRALKKLGPAQTIGIYGFGAAAHLVAQVAIHQGRQVYAFTRPDDAAVQAFARELGCSWAGGSDERSPAPLDGAMIFAPIGGLVPTALAATRKGGRVVCGGIHMSDIPAFPYDLLWGEREIVSVANLTRADAVEFLELSRSVPLKVATTKYALGAANDALADLRSGRLTGAAVLVP